MMSSRVERILEKLAQRQAPHLVPKGWNQSGDRIERIQVLARQLAHYQTLVILGDIDPDITTPDLHVEDWVRTCAQFYVVTAQRLFNSRSWIKAYFADDLQPPVVVLEGGTVPVLEVMAGTVMPYMTARQPKVIAQELNPLMDHILDELEARDLPENDYALLHQQGVSILSRMLAATVRYVSLTGFDQPFNKIIRKPDAPPPPRQIGLDDLTEGGHVPTEQLFSMPIPLPGTPKRRTAPLPKLPDDDDDV